MVCVGATTAPGITALLAPVRERVVISGTSRMMLEAQMFVMVFSSRLLAGRDVSRLAEGMTVGTGLTACGGEEGVASISSEADC